jgi:membrane protein involved in colicin uptake
MVISDEDEPGLSRRPLRERPQRQVHRDDEPEVHLEVTNEPSPEEALAETRRQLEETQRRAQTAERARREAEQQAAAAHQQAAAATSARQTDRATVIESVIAAARSEEDAAEAAYARARNEGDVAAEAAAMRAMNAAAVRRETAQRELDWAKANPPQQQQKAPQQNGSNFSPATQKWLDEHPAFFSDKRYERLARAASDEAIRQGHADGSQAYVDYVDRLMAEEYGEGHGQVNDRQPPTRQEPRGNGAATPSRRSMTGNSGGMKEVVIPRVGTIKYKREGGNLRTTMNEDMRAAFDEFAQISFPKEYAANPQRAIGLYVKDQIEHAEEVARGERGDIVFGDGGKWE